MLSFAQVFGTNYLPDSETAINLMKRELPRFLRTAGLKPDNIEWYAALRTKIDQCVNALIKQNRPLYAAFDAFLTQAMKFDHNTRAMLLRDKMPRKDWRQYMVADKCTKDIYRRLGNRVISTARYFKNQNRSKRSQLINKGLKKRMLAGLLTYSLRLNLEFQHDSLAAFDE